MRPSLVPFLCTPRAIGGCTIDVLPFLQELASQKEELSSTRDALSSDSAALQAQLQEAQSECDDLKQSVKAGAEKSQEQAARLQELESELKQANERNSSQLAELEVQLQAARSERDALKQSVDAGMAESQGQAGRIQELESELAQANERNVSQATELEMANKNVQENAGRIGDLEAQIRAMEGSDDDKEKRAAEMTQALQDAQAQLKASMADVEVLRADKAALEERLAALSGDLESVRNDNHELQKNVAVEQSNAGAFDTSQKQWVQSRSSVKCCSASAEGSTASFHAPKCVSNVQRKQSIRLWRWMPKFASLKSNWQQLLGGTKVQHRRCEGASPQAHAVPWS
jgi:chromosome segregation ATPase